MCSIELCLQTRWKSAISMVRSWSPPKSGWNIQDIPEDIAPENIRAAWHLRKQAKNQNAHDAVTEMARFIHANGIPVGKEVRSKIENQADLEWCSAEPNRCHKRILLNAASQGVAIPEQPDKLPVGVAVRRVSAPMQRAVARRSSGCSSCGGGRVR